MKAADLREGDDAPARRRLDFSRKWAIVAERLMWTRCVVVDEVGAQQPTQMPLVEHDDVVEAFSANGPDDALGEGILPGRAGRDENLVHPHAVDAAVKGAAVERVTIAEEIPWGCFVGERLNDLLGGPGSSGMAGDVDVNGLPAIVAEHDEREEQAEGQRSSAWMRRRPHVGFSWARRRMSVRNSASIAGRPIGAERDRHRQ